MPKHFFLFLTCLLLSLATLPAQNLGGGLALGFNLSQIDGDNEGGYRKFGASLGGYVSFRLSDHLVIQPEILWDQLGSVSREGFFNNRFNYFTFPILVNFSLPITLGDKVRDLQFQLGPAPAYLIGARDNLRTSSNNDISSDQNAIDFRLTGGLVLEVSDLISIAVRAGNSLLAFSEGSNIRFPQGGPRHRYVQTSLRIRLAE
jgi:hypothetical protein